MTEDEKKIIEQAAARAGKSFTRFVVDSALEKATETPNSETLAAMSELENGGGTVFESSTHDFLHSVLDEQKDK